MRKFAFALCTIAFAFGTATLPAVAAKQDGNPAAEIATPKKVVVKKAKSEKLVTYQRKCKAGMKWDATASPSAGACVKKAKVKSAPKAADAPTKQPAGKKAS